MTGRPVPSLGGVGIIWSPPDSPEMFIGHPPIFPPPKPEELLARPDVYRERLSKRAYRTPKDKLEDCPLFSLCRLDERLILNDNIGLRNEIEHIWYAKWPVASIPDPQDPSGSRYAVLSAKPPLLVEFIQPAYRARSATES
ncbi:hypothetical protein PDIDSM_4945 [Penicillium digitatum]|nr:hypothetical protein PDIDSM_4945 [Penicillium digitatum]